MTLLLTTRIVVERFFKKLKISLLIFLTDVPAVQKICNY
nr:MAG TPA: hypothetical protein [Caudoviricetes sp.]